MSKYLLNINKQLEVLSKQNIYIIKQLNKNKSLNRDSRASVAALPESSRISNPELSYDGKNFENKKALNKYKRNKRHLQNKKFKNSPVNNQPTLDQSPLLPPTNIPSNLENADAKQIKFNGKRNTAKNKNKTTSKNENQKAVNSNIKLQLNQTADGLYKYAEMVCDDIKSFPKEKFTFNICLNWLRNMEVLFNKYESLAMSINDQHCLQYLDNSLRCGLINNIKDTMAERGFKNDEIREYLYSDRSLIERKEFPAEFRKIDLPKEEEEEELDFEDEEERRMNEELKEYNSDDEIIYNNEDDYEEDEDVKSNQEAGKSRKEIEKPGVAANLKEIEAIFDNFGDFQ